jgi:hypothetical protein
VGNLFARFSIFGRIFGVTNKNMNVQILDPFQFNIFELRQLIDVSTDEVIVESLFKMHHLYESGIANKKGPQWV